MVRDTLLVLLGAAVVPLAQFIWALLQSAWASFRGGDWSNMNGASDSLPGALAALIIIGIIIIFLRWDDGKRRNREEERHLELIKAINDSSANTINGISPLVEAMNRQSAAVLSVVQSLDRKTDAILQTIPNQEGGQNGQSNPPASPPNT